MGYGVSTKGYNLYNFEKRTFFSHDVVFNEEEDGLKKEINQVNRVITPTSSCQRTMEMKTGMVLLMMLVRLDPLKKPNDHS